VLDFPSALPLFLSSFSIAFSTSSRLSALLLSAGISSVEDLVDLLLLEEDRRRCVGEGLVQRGKATEWEAEELTAVLRRAKGEMVREMGRSEAGG
jgi:hypothetical protein